MPICVARAATINWLRLRRAGASGGPALVIENDSELPRGLPASTYQLRFHAHGGVSVLHWELKKGRCRRA